MSSGLDAARDFEDEMSREPHAYRSCPWYGCLFCRLPEDAEVHKKPSVLAVIDKDTGEQL